AEPSSRAEGKKGGCLRRKARGFPHSRRQSRFFRDFDATLPHWTVAPQSAPGWSAIRPDPMGNQPCIRQRVSGGV
ncbi:MAG: hypothetical protein WCD04_09725, partial [Terriglobia bacterium]